METELSIVVNAVNDAAPALEEVTTQLDEVGVSATGLATTFEESVAELNAAMDLVDEGATTMASDFDIAMAEMKTAAIEMQSSLAVAAGTATEFDTAVAEGGLEAAIAQYAALGPEVEAVTLSMSELKSTAIQAGIVTTIVFEAFKAEVEDASKSATEWSETILGLNRELQNTGSSIPLKAIMDFGAQLSQNTLYSQQDILSSEAILMSYSNLEGQYQSITQAAADLAAKTGDDLPTAMGILTKALADPLTGVRQLQSAHINLSATVVKTINDLAQGGATAQADAVLMAALKEQIGGLSQSMAEAAGTGFTKLWQELGNLQIIIGQALNPLLDQLAKILIPIVTEVAQWVETHSKLTAYILLGVTAIAGLTVALVGIGIVVATVITSFTALGTLFTFLGTPVGLVITAFTAVGAAVTALAVMIKTNWGNIKDTIEGAATEILSFVQGWYNQIMGWINNILNSMKGIGSSIGGGVTNAWNGAVSGVENFFTHLASGGIVTSPTYALIGEAGPEAVIPLSAFANGESLAGAGGGGGGNGSINVYITGTVMSTEQQATMLGNQIARQINRTLRLQSFR